MSTLATAPLVSILGLTSCVDQRKNEEPTTIEARASTTPAENARSATPAPIHTTESLGAPENGLPPGCVRQHEYDGLVHVTCLPDGESFHVLTSGVVPEAGRRAAENRLLNQILRSEFCRQCKWADSVDALKRLKASVGPTRWNEFLDTLDSLRFRVSLDAGGRCDIACPLPTEGPGTHGWTLFVASHATLAGSCGRPPGDRAFVQDCCFGELVLGATPAELSTFRAYAGCPALERDVALAVAMGLARLGARDEAAALLDRIGHADDDMLARTRSVLAAPEPSDDAMRELLGDLNPYF